ncbi:MAG: exosortase/archaeosortase family protein [Smithellaceae bacterium]
MIAPTFFQKYRDDIMKLGILLLVVLVLYSPTFKMFWYDWSHDDNYSHGFLVPFIVGYLVWTKRAQLGQLSPAPSWIGLLVLVGGVGLYILGTIGAEWFIRRASMIVVIGGLILYLYGMAYFRLLLFPLVYLIFMVPLPAIVYSAIAFRLQVLVSLISADVIRLVGIAVYRNGNILEVAKVGPLAVEEACSGMRSIMALLALSSLLAYILYKTRVRQWILVAFALPVAVITNIFRVTMTGILAYHFGREMAEGWLHESFGWIVFVIAFALLWFVSTILNVMWPEPKETSAS